MNECHLGGTFTVLQTAQLPEICSAEYCTVYSKEPFCRHITMIVQRAL